MAELKPHFVWDSRQRRRIGWRWGRLCASTCSLGGVDCYRNGVMVGFGRRRIVFVPTTRARSIP